MPTKNDKNNNKKRRVEHNTFNDNKLPTSLILSVFTTNSDARCLREKYERRFVKKNQQLLSFYAAYHLILYKLFVESVSKSGKTKCDALIKRNVIFSSKTKCNKIKTHTAQKRSI